MFLVGGVGVVSVDHVCEGRRSWVASRRVESSAVNVGSR